MDTIDSSQLWKTAQGELQLQVTPDIFEMYIQPAQALELIGDTLVLGCPNQFVVEWLQLRLDRVIKRTLAGIAGRPLATRYLLAPAGQLSLASLAGADLPPVALLRPGELREAGYVRTWHDLRLLYGPMIGLAGVGLWTEIRAAINETSNHPMRGYAWLGLRGLIEHYTEGRRAIVNTMDAMRDARLLTWLTGAELDALWEQNAARGVPDKENPGIPSKTLLRFFANPAASRVYTVNDPLELPEFCVAFGHTITFDATANRCLFLDYPGRIIARWQDWLKGLMSVNRLTTIGPDDWRRLGLL